MCLISRSLDIPVGNSSKNLKLTHLKLKIFQGRIPHLPPPSPQKSAIPSVFSNSATGTAPSQLPRLETGTQCSLCTLYVPGLVLMNKANNLFEFTT